jgi:hypothetical protein
VSSRGRSDRREGSATDLTLGKRVKCVDGPLGELDDVVIDPIAKRVTHLVVQPFHQHGRARLVPIELAEGGRGAAITLRCTLEEVRRLAPVQEMSYLRLDQYEVDDPDWDVGVKEVFAMPYYDTAGFATTTPGLGEDVAVLYDRVPKGEVEVRRSSSVVSADDRTVGSVEGFLVDEGQITHLVLERGHLWGKREITIPIGAIAKVSTDEVRLRLTKHELGELPSVPVHRWRS